VTRFKVGLRRSALSAALILFAPLAVACSAQVGSAAVVGDVPIPTSGVEAEVSAVATVGADTTIANLGDINIRVATGRTLLTNDIRHQLLVQSGKAVPLTPDEVTQTIATFPEAASVGKALGATPETLNERISDAAVLRSLVRDAIDSGTEVTGPTVTVDALSAPDLATAMADRTRYLADPALMTAAVTEAAATKQGQLGLELPVLTYADFISTGLYSVAPGQIVVAGGASSALLVRVVSRSTGPLALDATAASQLSTTQINAIGALILQQRVTGLPTVQVNPRYGVWDPALLQVVAAPGQL
jgi:hypothetical protein